MNISRRYIEQAPDRQAIAAAMSSMDFPALIDIRYSTLCSPVHNESRSLLIAMLQHAPPTCGSPNAAASRATAVGSNTVSASTVKSRSPPANRAAAAARAVADDQVHQAVRSGALRDSAGIVGRAVIHDDDFERPQGLSVQRCDRRAEPGAAVECRYDHADRNVAGGRAVASAPRAEQSQ